VYFTSRRIESEPPIHPPTYIVAYSSLDEYQFHPRSVHRFKKRLKSLRAESYGRSRQRKVIKSLRQHLRSTPLFLCVHTDFACRITRADGHILMILTRQLDLWRSSIYLFLFSVVPSVKITISRMLSILDVSDNPMNRDDCYNKYSTDILRGQRSFSLFEHFGMYNGVCWIINMFTLKRS